MKLIRIRTYTIPEVLDYITDQHVSRDYGGIQVWMDSDRYWTFKHSGTKCVRCGLEATFFALEWHIGTPPGRGHFNLYGIDIFGEERLFTKDHIIPKSKGGPDDRSNYQTMCSVCNQMKANKLKVHSI